jgi:GNAT superfamily N-acetyltransferase
LVEDVDIQPMSVDDLTRMSEVDRTELMAAKYDVVRSTDGLSLSLVQRECDPPEEFPHWDEAGITRRIDYYRREIAGGGAVFGAFAGQRLVGFVAVAVREEQAAEVLGVFADASRRRCGIGGRLLAAAEEWAGRAGANTMYVHSNPTVLAVGFYRKHGYVLSCLVDEATLEYPAMETCMVLAKKLERGEGVGAGGF